MYRLQYAGPRWVDKRDEAHEHEAIGGGATSLRLVRLGVTGYDGLQ